ncbi:STAS/SEC14 domain-containing protein [Microbacterium marmarense]|uniref:STAS/SEC14 domain-containing protein n=1 Tax=Microbacterium marmarense TaxID=3122051 RepID=A0ABU8LRJ9_9MICO
MIETLSDLPDGVLGFRAVGEISASDYEAVLDPAIDAALEVRDRVNIVFVLGDEFERYSLGAMWQDAALGGKPHSRWGRIALVTNHSLIAEIVHGVAFMVPAEVKVFPLEALDSATHWAGGAAETKQA